MSTNELKVIIEETLNKLGFYRHDLAGRELLATAVFKCCQDPDWKYKVTALYEVVGKEKGTTWSRVERNIRNVIEHRGMMTIDPPALREMFSSKKITNKLAITSIVDYIRLQYLIKNPLEEVEA